MLLDLPLAQVLAGDTLLNSFGRPYFRVTAIGAIPNGDIAFYGRDLANISALDAETDDVLAPVVQCLGRPDHRMFVDRGEHGARII